MFTKGEGLRQVANLSCTGLGEMGRGREGTKEKEKSKTTKMMTPCVNQVRAIL